MLSPFWVYLPNSLVKVPLSLGIYDRTIEYVKVMPLDSRSFLNDVIYIIPPYIRETNTEVHATSLSSTSFSCFASLFSFEASAFFQIYFRLRNIFRAHSHLSIFLRRCGSFRYPVKYSTWCCIECCIMCVLTLFGYLIFWFFFPMELEF